MDTQQIMDFLRASDGTMLSDGSCQTLPDGLHTNSHTVGVFQEHLHQLRPIGFHWPFSTPDFMAINISKLRLLGNYIGSKGRDRDDRGLKRDSRELHEFPAACH